MVKQMDKHELTELLNHVADGSVSPDDAALKLKMQPFQEILFWEMVQHFAIVQ